MAQRRSKIARDILRYIEKNPEATDTAEGITKWWLADKYSVSEVAEALSKLVEEGAVSQRRGKNSQTVYKKKARRAAHTEAE